MGKVSDYFAKSHKWNKGQVNSIEMTWNSSYFYPDSVDINTPFMHNTINELFIGFIDKLYSQH